MPIIVQTDAFPGPMLEQHVDEDINNFDAYQQKVLRVPGQPTTPLTKYERSIIKTYLAWKLGLGPNIKT